MDNLLSIDELEREHNEFAELQQVYSRVYREFTEFIEHGGIPVMEYPIDDDEYLTIQIGVAQSGVFFTFDDLGLPIWFDGGVKRHNDGYIVPFDVFTDKFSSYLQIISDNITEGFILPNGLLPAE